MLDYKRKNNSYADELVWLDMEMSGLDIYKDVVLEVAVVVTDAQLNILDEPISYVIHQPEHLLANMDEWNCLHHGRSGLIEEVKESSYDVAFVEEQILAYVKKFIPNKKAPLCGNTIGQDRRFLYRDMPVFSEYLHYRNVDVSSFKEAAKRWCPDLPSFKKNASGGVSHRAKDDILDSISEMLYYKTHLIQTRNSLL